MKRNAAKNSLTNTGFHWLGLLDYNHALEKQLRLWQEVTKTGQAEVLGLEHPAVITLGRRAHQDSEIKRPLISNIVETDRGGQATLHSPGQLVIYPIAPVKNFGGLRSYVDLLLQCTQRVLAKNGISAHTSSQAPGLYTSKGKICFIGLRIEKGVSRHGLSLNISNDLTLFQAIRPCGVSDAPMDSMAQWAPAPSPAEVFHQWSQIFRSMLKDR